MNATTNEPLVGWCPDHQMPAVIYDDGSLTCMHELIVESRCDECSVVPVPVDRLYAASLRGQG